MPVYNKAIRDKIPEIIESDGKKFKVETLTDSKFLEKIELKLLEEANEYLEDKNPKELADLLEVIYRVAALRGIERAELEKLRLKKCEKRGGFEGNLFLIEVED